MGTFHRHHGFSGTIGFLGQQNSAPKDLNTTAQLTIAENQTIGTIVGEFNATDPDVNSTLTYHLVSGAGDGNNSLFSMDANGTLRTAAQLDYEAGSSLAIRVQAKDEHNSTVEGAFSIALLDQPESPVFVDLGTSYTIYENTTQSITIGFHDPDGDTLVYSMSVWMPLYLI